MSGNSHKKLRIVKLIDKRVSHGRIEYQATLLVGNKTAVNWVKSDLPNKMLIQQFEAEQANEQERRISARETNSVPAKRIEKSKSKQSEDRVEVAPSPVTIHATAKLIEKSKTVQTDEQVKEAPTPEATSAPAKVIEKSKSKQAVEQVLVAPTVATTSASTADTLVPEGARSSRRLPRRILGACTRHGQVMCAVEYENDPESVDFVPIAEVFADAPNIVFRFYEQYIP